MTVLTPTEEGVKVFTLPEEPELFNADRNDKGMCKLAMMRNGIKLQQYNKRLEEAKSSAILVKDQDEAWRMIFPELKKANHIEVKGDIIRYKHPNTKFYDHILINYESLYPIPGLKYTVEKGCAYDSCNTDGRCEHCQQEITSAILSLEEEKKEPVKEVKHTPLLPCPFCNTQPEWINEALPDDHFYIRCPHCHIVMKEDRRDKVIGMWNRRQSPVSDGETQDKIDKAYDDFENCRWGETQEELWEAVERDYLLPNGLDVKRLLKKFTIQRKVKQ